jgi:hypothetical protein
MATTSCQERTSGPPRSCRPLFPIGSDGRRCEKVRHVVEGHEGVARLAVARSQSDPALLDGVSEACKIHPREPERPPERRRLGAAERDRAAHEREPVVHEEGAPEDREGQPALDEKPFDFSLDAERRNLGVLSQRRHRHEDEPPHPVAAAGVDQVSIALLFRFAEAVGPARDDDIGGRDDRLGPTTRCFDTRGVAQIAEGDFDAFSLQGMKRRPPADEGPNAVTHLRQAPQHRRSELSRRADNQSGCHGATPRSPRRNRA